MRLRWPIFIPLAAFILVAAMISVTLAAKSIDAPPAAPTAVPPASTPVPTPTSLPRSFAQSDEPSFTVCEGAFERSQEDESLAFAPEYTQHREALGISIVAGAGVASEALDIAQETIERMFRNNDLDAPLREAQAYVIVAEPGQGVLDLPEFACLADEVRDDFFDHVCGVADRAAFPVVTVNALDLLGDESGPCGGVNILFHELGHLVQGWSMGPADYFDARLLHHDATAAGLYEGAYASRNFREYWAEGTQAFFLHLNSSGENDRQWLQDYDPALYELMTIVFGEGGQ